MKAFPLLVGCAMANMGCHQSVVEGVRNALESMGEEEVAALWFRLNGYSYREIADALDCNRMKAFRIINKTMKDTIYSIIERGCDVTIAV